MDINKIEQTKNRRQQAISAKADPVEVFCRVRPMNDSDESCLRILDDSTLMLTIPEVLISFSYSSVYLSFKQSFLLFYYYSVRLPIDRDRSNRYVYIYSRLVLSFVALLLKVSVYSIVGLFVRSSL